MTLLNTYLSETKVKKVLSLKPGEEGFSLIELVVVVAVLAVLSAIAIPQFTNISNKARAAAASNTVATIAKECAAKVADAGSGTYTPPISMQGYKTGNVPGWYPTVTAPTTAQGALNAGGLGNKSATATATACPIGSGIFGLVSEDSSQYPDFFYNNGTGAKVCVATGDALNRGCTGGTW
tara:strand:+ start:1277 stop:1816 length:540 start_codon:yes stop_codon:yes gene_type:complete